MYTTPRDQEKIRADGHDKSGKAVRYDDRKRKK
jgi:hypothetical protein